MRETRFGRSFAHWLAALFCALGLVNLAPTSAFAGDDDFDFSDDGGGGGDFDFSDDGSGGTQGGGEAGGGEGFDFTDTSGTKTDPATTFTMPDGSKPIILAYFDPVDKTDQRVLDRLNEALIKHLTELEDYDTVTGIIIKAELDGMSADERDTCANDPPCIAGIAKPMGVSKVVVGRIRTEDLQRPVITLDMVDVNSEALENFIEFEASARVKGQEKELRPAAYKLFGRSVPVDPIVEDPGKGKIEETGLGTGQLVASISSGVAGLALVGLGVKFGLDASALQDELITERDNRTIHQRDAQTKLDDANGAATIANVFYGVGAVAIAASVVILLVRPGEDVAEDQRTDAVDFFFEPLVGPNGAALVGGVRF